MQGDNKALKILLFVTLLPLCSSSFAEVLLRGDFETGGSFPPAGATVNGFNRHGYFSDTLEIANGPRRGGAYGIKFKIKKADPWGVNGAPKMPRAQLYRDSGAGREFVIGKVYWVGLSMYIPKDWVNDPSPEEILDWHMRADPGEQSASSPIRMWIKDDKMLLKVSWDSRRIWSPPMEGNEQIWSDKLEKGKWLDFVFKLRFSYKHDGQGLTMVWKDGNLIANRIGPNAYNDIEGRYLKFGLYKWEWIKNPANSITTQRELYFDEIRIGDANASYDDVKPRGDPVVESGSIVLPRSPATPILSLSR